MERQLASYLHWLPASQEQDVYKRQDMSLLDTAIDAGVIPNRFEQYEEAYEKTDSLIKSYVDEEGDSSTFLFQMKNQIDKILKK